MPFRTLPNRHGKIDFGFSVQFKHFATGGARFYNENVVTLWVVNLRMAHSQKPTEKGVC